MLDELEALEANGMKMEVEVGVLGKELDAAKHQAGLLYNDHLEKVKMWEEERGKLEAAAMEAEQRLAAAQAKVEECEEYLDTLAREETWCRRRWQRRRGGWRCSEPTRRY